MRPLRKLAYREEFAGNTERRTAAYKRVREDSSTGSTYKLPLEVEFPKRSIEMTWHYSHGLVLPSFLQIFYYFL
ncbi:palindromic element RPE1 domain-containing protein [Rickettsia rickettsii str. 'Sheila Smith']|nr:palindromic element RPE1 domain-containing protein [Rickettsia rickettsii]USD86105.1 palindromic element RPE1 domain-containing protein [Rickettsia rickettsii]USD87420.1 palindromic element RPE1 domain-containing protein [Rickettsia rickettsii]USD88735.1 palindromic element RPE1 domain-containing protein [Rickettsia rickettsii]WGQ96162.1 palindromic element RPE1 domain-containing protein [Rickettsia rickettsii str. 'Sheila Smith']